MKKIIYLLMLAALLAGCAISSGRKKYTTEQASLSPEVKTAILKGRVIEGMTKDDVKAAWGAYSRKEVFSDTEEDWWYEPFWPFGETTVVKFKQGKVSNIYFLKL